MSEGAVVDLGPLFDSLGLPSTGGDDHGALSAMPVPGFPAHRIAKDSRGGAKLLLRTGHAEVMPPIQLENLSVEHGVACRIWKDNIVTDEGLFTVISCSSADQALRNQFLHVAGSLLAAIGPRPAPEYVAELISALVDLFRAATEPPRKAISGLWAELLLMARAGDATALARAWHASPDERYDFSAGSHRIEVKCAVGRERQHHFSLEQVTPPETCKVLIASVCTERSGGGTTIRDLLSLLRHRLESQPELSFRLEVVAAQTLGSALQVAMEQGFDLQLAVQTMAFIDARLVPRPAAPIPKEISQVRFCVDLAGTPPISQQELELAGGLFVAATPTTRG